MRSAKLVLASAFVALAVSACGSSGGVPATPAAGRGKVDDPRTTKNNHVACLRKDGFTVTKLTLGGLPSLQIGSPPSGPTVMFTATAGIAQGAVMQGLKYAQGAEVIGSALLFPNQGTSSALNKIENCLSQGVNG